MERLSPDLPFTDIVFDGTVTLFNLAAASPERIAVSKLCRTCSGSELWNGKELCLLRVNDGQSVRDGIWEFCSLCAELFSLSLTPSCGMSTNLSTEGVFPSSVSAGGWSNAPSLHDSVRDLLKDCDRFTTARANGEGAELE